MESVRHPAREHRARVRPLPVGLLCMALDGAMLFVALAFATFGAEAGGAPLSPLPWLVAFPFVVWGFLFALGAYSPTLRRSVVGDLPWIIGATTGATLFLLLVQLAVVQEAPLLEAVRPWLFASFYLVAGRLTLHWSEVVPLTGAARRRTVAHDLADEGAKRMLDVAAAGLLLLVLAPLLALVALLIKLDSPGPVFYRCRRVGYRGAELAMLKFRKMRPGADGLPLTLSEDERFTRIGRLLARTKLDEVPQLWNVLRGEMSLVGPRPEDRSFVELHRDAYEEILQVRPGVTGLCQLAFAEESSILDPADRVRDYTERLLPQKTRLDRLYASRRSVGMDLRILAWTVLAVALKQAVAVHRESGRLTVRRREERRQTAPLAS